MDSSISNSLSRRIYPLDELINAPVNERCSLIKLAREEGKSPPTAWRWAMKGCRGLRLPTFMCGNVRMTTRPAYRWWLIQLTAIAEGELVPSRTNKQREAAIERAERELAEMGI